MRAPNPGEMTLTGTNTWLIRNEGHIAVVDPGPDHVAHIATLRGMDVTAVLLTHRHGDHVAALALLDDSIPVYAADPAFARGTPPLQDGEQLEINGADIGVVATPGHTDDSLCFSIPAATEGPAMLTGDTLLGGRTATLVSRHTGDLAALLRSLEALSALSGSRGLPGHGDPFPDVATHAQDALQHRRRRLDDLERLVTANPELSATQVAGSRHPTDPVRQRAAIWMLEIELQHLRTAGRVGQ